VNNGVSSKNYVNYSSVVRCVNERSNPRFVLWLNQGKICCPSINLSMNKCVYYTIIYFLPFMGSNSVTCLISHSSFTDNIATQHTCFHIRSYGAKCEMKSCNILRNTQGSIDSYGIIYTYDKLVIKDSCILENRANRIFHQNSLPITLSNCTVDSTSNNGYLTIQNTVTKSFILGLNHMSTRNCYAEYDSAGYLTPIIQTPTSTKKHKYYYSCGNSFNQCQLRDFVSLICVFIFNFIHLSAFG
jgi:hypothetical protein